MNRRHTDREFEAELETIRHRITTMGQTVEQMIADSVDAFCKIDDDLAYKTIRLDDDVDRLEVDTDELCLAVLARRQPLGPDLRFVTTALKLVTDIERTADMCVSICERTIELSQEPLPEPMVDLLPMAKAVLEMVRMAIQAFTAGDAERANNVVLRDRTVDAHYAQVSRKLHEWMTDQHVSMSQASRLQAVAKYIERIGDHATNIAEQVVFMIKGKDIRHVSRRAENQQGRPRGILFICVRNAARSQMAEGWARKLLPPSIDVYSAGSDPAAQVHPQAVSVMAEVGIDISSQQPKRISDVPLGKVDIVVALCVEEVCVTLPGMVRREAWALPDPAGVTADEQKTHEAFTSIRDRIRASIEELATRILAAK
ncbi:MAG: phosphate signaling complex protein PhoU [Phycisphaerae bacterium]|nr:phosphate signaling complex protein PhoU [Phycisphaerae bacterium]